MEISLENAIFSIDELSPLDISIPLNFNGPQPNAYGVDEAGSRLLGDTRGGASVNFESVTFVPHCSGTHTECVGHITKERISVRECLQDIFVNAVLISVEAESEGDDVVLSKSGISQALEVFTYARATDNVPTALIVRTLPNDDSKLTRKYGEYVPPYFTVEAMEFIVDCGFKHLLVDMPSVDRIYDEGKLANHRIFWNIELGSFEINADTRVDSTITELIYVPPQVIDGEYMLNLQIAPFESDAAPSRPLIFKIN